MQMLDYNVPGGKLNRGMAVGDILLHLTKDVRINLLFLHAVAWFVDQCSWSPLGMPFLLQPHSHVLHLQAPLAVLEWYPRI